MKISELKQLINSYPDDYEIMYTTDDGAEEITGISDLFDGFDKVIGIVIT